MKTLMPIILFLICYVPTLVIFSLTPYITRKTESFGISIPEEHYMDAGVKRIRQSYRNSILVIGGFISVLMLALIILIHSDAVVISLPIGIIVMTLIMFFRYWKGHKLMKDLKDRNNWMNNKKQLVMVDTGFRNKKIIASPLWFTLYLAVIIGTAIFGFAYYGHIPDRIPMHWNISGVADRFVDKSYRTILWGPFVQIFMTIIMAFSYWIISKGKQLIDPAQPEKSSEQGRIFRYRWSMFLIFTGLALNIMFGIIQILSYGLIKSTLVVILLPMVFVLGILTASIILSVTTGQGGSRVRLSTDGKDEKENRYIKRDDDRYWKLGLIYYNPDDPSLIVERRFGIGWTFNFGRKVAWVMLGGLLVLIVGFALASIFLFK
ncbi:MAG: DUF1648 domain-containing protein [Bacillota bacterium]|nr:DUF1648 domain-containing protein [Bacillota bacterium]